MADFYGIQVVAWRRLVEKLTTGEESLRLFYWAQTLANLKAMQSRSILGASGTFHAGAALLTEPERDLFDSAVLPDLADKRLNRLLRRILLETCDYTFSTREPRLSATLGISIPDAGLFQNEAERSQWQLLVDTWVYPQTSPPSDLWFLADDDSYCGLASPDVVRELLQRDAGTGLFRRVAAYYCGEEGEFASLVAFLGFCALEGVWVYSNDLRT